MNDYKIKNMNEKKILVQNIGNKMKNHFKYKKTELLKSSVFLYYFIDIRKENYIFNH